MLFSSHWKTAKQGATDKGRKAVLGAAGGVLLMLVLTWVISANRLPLAQGGPRMPTAQEKAVTLMTKREGGVTHFYVENEEYCEVTMTFEMKLMNLKGSTDFPYTATFPARRVTEAFTVFPTNDSGKWEYSYTNYYKLGSNCAQHDDSL